MTVLVSVELLASVEPLASVVLLTLVAVLLHSVAVQLLAADLAVVVHFAHVFVAWVLVSAACSLVAVAVHNKAVAVAATKRFATAMLSHA